MPIQQVGRTPLPPYIRRENGVSPRVDDAERYQTVYAERAGAVAAPTAGLHFTADLLDEIRADGVTVEALTLHVGWGTFQPVRVERLEDHRMHAERFSIPARLAEAAAGARRSGGRIVAIGTTVVRALETVTAIDGTAHAATGWTDVVVTPDRGAPGIDGLLTGWHAPASSHLDMLEAIGGADIVAASYDAAFAGGYLWHEFGDLHLMFRPERAVLSGLRTA